MLFELLHAPFPDGYGEAILPLEACKEHLRADGDDEDDLIGALRDAAIDFVERFCELKLGSTAGLIWQADGFPPRSTAALRLSLAPVTAISAISWLNSDGASVEGNASDYRLTTRGDVLPAVGGAWPSTVAGGVSIEFTAGYAEGAAPPSLLAAVRLFLGHLYKNREAVTDRGTEGEVPFGVRQLCAPFRRVLI